VDLSNVPRLTPEQIAAIVPQLTPEQVAAIVPQSPYAKVDLSNCATIDLSNFPQLTPEQIAAIVPRLTQEQIDAIMPEYSPYAKVDLSNVEPQPPVDWIVQQDVLPMEDLEVTQNYGKGAILTKTKNGIITISGTLPGHPSLRFSVIDTTKPVGARSYRIKTGLNTVEGTQPFSCTVTTSSSSGGVPYFVDVTGDGKIAIHQVGSSAIIPFLYLIRGVAAN
jgi:uncharacterized protein (DUF433 family)